MSKTTIGEFREWCQWRSVGFQVTYNESADLWDLDLTSAAPAEKMEVKNIKFLHDAFDYIIEMWVAAFEKPEVPDEKEKPRWEKDPRALGDPPKYPERYRN